MQDIAARYSSLHWLHVIKVWLAEHCETTTKPPEVLFSRPSFHAQNLLLPHFNTTLQASQLMKTE